MEVLTAKQVEDAILEAIRSCIANNIFANIDQHMPASIGSFNIFKDDILPDNVNTRSAYSTILASGFPMTQILGRIIRSDDIIKAWLQDDNAAINASVMSNTWVDTETESNTVRVNILVPNGPGATEYCRQHNIRCIQGSGMIQLTCTPRSDGVVVSTAFDANGMSGAISFIRMLDSFLHTYCNILRNLVLCHPSTISFPTFQSTATAE